MVEPILRLAGREDLPAIAGLLPELGGPQFFERFPGKDTTDFLRWKYFENPLGEAIVGIAVADERVLSLVASVPTPLQVGQETRTVVQYGDFLTVPEYRKRGLFSRLVEMVATEAAARGAALAYCRPNENSFPIMMRCSFEEPRQIQQRRFLVPSQTLARKLRVPLVASNGLGLDSLVQRLCMPPCRDRRLAIETVTRFGEEFDEFWEQARRDYQFVISRGSQYLNWRYADGPTPFQIRRACRGGKTVGFLVSFLSQSTRTAFLVDLFICRDDLAAARALLDSGFREWRREGMQAVYVWSPVSPERSPLDRLIRRAFPLAERTLLHFVVRVFDQTLAHPLPGAGWHLSLGDFDGI